MSKGYNHSTTLSTPYISYVQAEYHDYWVSLSTPVPTLKKHDIEERNNKIFTALAESPLLSSAALTGGNIRDTDDMEITLCGVVRASGVFNAQLQAGQVFYPAFKAGYPEGGPGWIESKVKQLSDKDD